MHERESRTERESVEAGQAGRAWAGRQPWAGRQRTGMQAMGVPGAEPTQPGRIPWLESTLSRWLPSPWGGETARRRSGAERRDGGKEGPWERGWSLAGGRETVPDSVDSVAHDVRNMMAALDLYCDLLEEPGVLDTGFRHYAGELRMVAGACHDLAGRLAELPAGSGRREEAEAAPEFRGGMGRRRGMTGLLVENLAEELLANKNLLSALAGPGITVGMHFDGGAQGIALTPEDLTRVLINLVKNASEAMPGGGHIQIGLEEHDERLLLTVADSGPGVEEEAMEAVFAPGYSTRVDLDREDSSWPVRHQGLGLAIVRSLVTAAGGCVWVQNRGPAADGADAAGQHGAVFTMEFPARE